MIIFPVIQQSAMFNPVFILDAGKTASYSGSGQTWANLVTPADGELQTAYDFYRGGSASADGDDPAFNGTAGGDSSSEYFSFDGGDYLSIPANTTFINSLHKDNASFTFLCCIRFGGATSQSIFGSSVSGGRGLALKSDSGGLVNFIQRNGASSYTIYNTPSAAYTSGSWYMLALSYSEATGSGMLYVRDASKTTYSFTQTYTSASSSDASYRLGIGSEEGGSSADVLSSGSRIKYVAMWNKSLSEAQLDAVFNKIKYKIGL